MNIEQFRTLFDETRGILEAEGFSFTDQEFDVNDYMQKNQGLRDACARHGRVFPEDVDPLSFDAETFDMRAFVMGAVNASRGIDIE
ncbi:hypothetical protein WKR88_10685 [Trinickia caryophylli]|uniref:Uncharacterized protein n=1 Tax=Trinickia caryophylli TaxID=28094 RepID=A0A1X7HAL4_TRICW|nr:hypothetical protein [Trinickia caryophylli]PMS08712.1 hypothetical protein C0Z17_28775 [Trinickia caryophylli]TRX18284.1 hypothetical protein FNF07_08675 [Trinickia caryophylli]WQE10930.1 hypothetical protein U0034_14240 [Trinickia caryophylli]SMF82849.1 hypothetical protein SAMN06295900_12810 [Trinickia caryophylli]GLU35872.1 hypothetical protein Busp01_57140 [Trinickia caryophylli]